MARTPMKRLLLISNSTLYGSGYLDHAENEIRDFLGGASRIAFVPFALFDRGRYAAQARERFARISRTLISVHDVSNPQRLVVESDAIFVGGGNTFRLLKGLYDFDLLFAIRQAVHKGVPYIGSSAGSIVACPSLKTTKDMPVAAAVICSLGTGEFPDQPALSRSRSSLKTYGRNAGRTHPAVSGRKRSPSGGPA